MSNPLTARLNKTLFDSQVRVLGVGAPHDWNLRALKTSEDLANPNNSLVALMLSNIGNKYNVKKFLAPSVIKQDGSFCHQFGDTSSPADLIVLPWSESILQRNFMAEGVIIEPGSAFVVAAADCVISVGRLPDGKIVAFHAGRDSLFDKALLTSGTPSLEYASIVEAMLKYLEIYNLYGSEWWFSPSISPGPHFEHRWDDPVHGHTNECMVNFLIKQYGNRVVSGDKSFGRIDVRAILAAQLLQKRVEPDNITLELVCTYLSTQSDGSPTWNSHRREPAKKARNLFVVINNG